MHFSPGDYNGPGAELMSTILPPPSAIHSIMEHVPIGVVGVDANLIVVGGSRHSTAMLDLSERIREMILNRRPASTKVNSVS